MDTKPTIGKALNIAFDEGNISEFKRLIDEHPTYIRSKDGTDRWMWMAAMVGNLEMLKFLVKKGLDVNESSDIPDPDDPFCTYEGPILQAASAGHTEIVRWLLEQGAKINFTINGKIRCLPLLDAAINGHLDIAKLLVEHGAEVNFTFNGHTPLSQAEAYGHPEVAEYLRSVGAK